MNDARVLVLLSLKRTSYRPVLLYRRRIVLGRTLCITR